MLPTREACVLHVWHKCDVVYKNSCILKRRSHVVSLGFLVGNGAKLDLFSLLLIHDVLLLFWFLSDCFFKMTLCLLFRFLLEIIIVYLLFKKAFFLLSFEVTYTQKLIKAFVKPRWQGLSKTTTKSALLCISKESLFKVKLELSNCPISVCGHAALGPIVLSAVFVTFCHCCAWEIFWLLFCMQKLTLSCLWICIHFFQDSLSCFNPKKCLLWL